MLVPYAAGPMCGVRLLSERPGRQPELLVKAPLVTPPDQVLRHDAGISRRALLRVEVRRVGPRVRPPPELRPDVDGQVRPLDEARDEVRARLEAVVAVGEPQPAKAGS